MKIYTFYSDSHKSLYNLFLESISKTNPNLEIETDILPQEGSGSFMEEGWEKTMTGKVDQIIKACRRGEIFIHSDSDVVFLKNIEDRILEELGDFDIAFQDDGAVGVCMGFFICRPTSTVISLFEEVKSILSEFQGHDQNALNSIISKYPVKYKRLSPLFFNYGQLGLGVWKGEEFEVNPEIYLLHANWVIGVENKISLINYVSSSVLKN